MKEMQTTYDPKQFEENIYRAGVENGRLRRAPLTGFWISLCANVPNLLFALFISLGLWFPDVTALSSIGGVATSETCW